MPKILSQAGKSLADAYDIEGSIAGIDQLVSQDVNLVHDMGKTMFQERLHGFLIQATTTAIAQNISWDVEISGFPPDIPERVLGVSLLANQPARILRASLAIQNPDTGRETPFWYWDNVDDVEISIRWSQDGLAVTTFNLLDPRGASHLPTMLIRLGDQDSMPSIFFRGTTAGFGAGTVNLFALIHVARAARRTPTAAEPSGVGLPIPGW